MSSQTTTSLGQFEVLSIFKEKMVMFLDSLIELFPEQSELIVARMFFADQLPIQDFVDNFSQNILPYKELITNRKNEFFLMDNNPLFMSYGKKNMGLWKILWQSSALDNEDRKRIWQWLDLFVALSEMYIKNKK